MFTPAIAVGIQEEELFTILTTMANHLSWYRVPRNMSIQFIEREMCLIWTSSNKIDPYPSRNNDIIRINSVHVSSSVMFS